MIKTSCPKTIKIMLVGEGGQGIQTIAKLLAKASFEQGYHSSYIPNFGTEQRGGISIAFIQISCDTIISPKFNTADVFVIVSERNIERTLRYIGSKTSVVYDADLVNNRVVSKMKRNSKDLHPINAFSEATRQLTERSFNIIILGILIGLVDINLLNKDYFSH